MIKLATYNIHSCVGSDGVKNAGRVAAAIAKLEADVVGLQEVESVSDGTDEGKQLDYLAGINGMEFIPGPTLYRRDGDYGNGLLTRLPVTGVRRMDISMPGWEPRGVIEAELDAGGRPFFVYVTHLGLRWRERADQAAMIVEMMKQREGYPMALLADLNEWTFMGGGVRRFQRLFGAQPAAASFPARFPFLRLDRILVHPQAMAGEFRCVKEEIYRVASDHLPVTCTVTLD